MPAGARTDSQQITLFDYYDFHIKTTCYHPAGKYLFNSHRGFDAGECHHQIISFPTFFRPDWLSLRLNLTRTPAGVGSFLRMMINRFLQYESIPSGTTYLTRSR